MSNPCEINDCVPAEEINRWGCLKWIVFAALLGLGILLLLLRGCVGDTTPPPTATQTPTTVAAATDDDSAGIDLVAPSLTLSGITAGKALLSGVGMPDSIVRIFDGDVEVGQATVNGDGNWSFEADANPDSRFRAVGELADGTVVGESAELRLTVTRLTAAGLTAGAGEFTLNGTGARGFNVNVLVGDVEAANTTIDADGNWSVSAAMPDLDAGDYTVSAEMVDVDGDIFGTVANAGTLSIAAPMASLVTNDFELDGTTFQWSGTGEPGATVNILLDGEVIGSTVVGDDGTWQFTGDVSGLDAGEYAVSAEMVDADGNTLAENSADMSLTIDSAGDVAPLTTGELVAADGTYNWSGTGEPGATIVIVLNGEEVGTTTVDADGTWTFEGSYAGFEAGEFPLTARMVDGDGTELDEAVDAAQLTITQADTGGSADPDTVGRLEVLFARTPSSGGDDNGVISPVGAPGVALILDSSWSMTFGVDYTGVDVGPDTDESQRLRATDPNSRIAVAKDGLSDFIINSLPHGMPTALRVFGNLEGNLACQTDLMIPYGELDKTAMLGRIDNVIPQFNANTAIADSLNAIRTDLADADTNNVTIVLVTDGDETCGGDPEAAIMALNEAGFDVELDIIGFAINDDDLSAKLQSWAELGNGSYFSATDAESLAEALQGAFAIPYRILDESGAEVATGTVGGEAIELIVGNYTIELETSPAVSYEVAVAAEQTTTLVAD